jgi:pantothenate kinase
MYLQTFHMIVTAILLTSFTASLTSNFPIKPHSSNQVSPKSYQTPQIQLKSSDTSALLNRALEVWKRSCNQSQIYVGIAGAPGSGKSTLGQRLVDAINRGQNDTSFSTLIPMDGYHYTKAQLRCMGESGQRIGDLEATSGETTTYDDLMRHRGAPWTFDSNSLIQDLASTKERGYGSFPLYNRGISDPRPDQILVTRHHKIVVCEGNYLLSFDDPAWKPLQNLWDDTWIIDIPEPILKERLVRRHLQNWTPTKEALFGVGRVGATLKVESSDLKNAHFVYRMSRNHANVIIRNT